MCCYCYVRVPLPCSIYTVCIYIIYMYMYFQYCLSSLPSHILLAYYNLHRALGMKKTMATGVPERAGHSAVGKKATTVLSPPTKLCKSTTERHTQIYLNRYCLYLGTKIIAPHAVEKNHAKRVGHKETPIQKAPFWTNRSRASVPVWTMVRWRKRYRPVLKATGKLSSSHKCVLFIV